MREKRDWDGWSSGRKDTYLQRMKRPVKEEHGHRTLDERKWYTIYGVSRPMAPDPEPQSPCT